jgi:hypothetical protein
VKGYIERERMIECVCEREKERKRKRERERKVRERERDLGRQSVGERDRGKE